MRNIDLDDEHHIGRRIRAQVNYRAYNQGRQGIRVQIRTDKNTPEFEAGFWVPEWMRRVRGISWQRAMKFRTQGPSAPARIGWSLMYYSRIGRRTTALSGGEVAPYDPASNFVAVPRN